MFADAGCLPLAACARPNPGGIVVVNPAPKPIDTVKPSNTRQAILLVICLMYLISYLDRVTISVAAPKIIQEFHFNKETMGLIFSAFAWSYALLQIVGGTLGDRFGPRKILTTLMTWWSAFTVLTGFAWGVASFFVIRLLFGLGEAGGFPVATRALSTWFPATERGWLQGITHAFARIGAAVAPPIIVWITLSAGGWRPSFYILGFLGFIWAIAFFWFFRDRPEQKETVNAAELREIYGPSGAARKTFVQPNIPWGSILRNKDVWLLIATDFCYGYSLWIYLTWLPTYLTSARHFSFKGMGFYAALPLLGGVVGDIFGGKLTDGLWHKTGNLKLARRATIATALVGSLIFSVPSVYVPSAYVAVGLQTLAFFFLEIAVSGLWAVSMDLGGRNYTGTVSGLMNTGFGLAGIVSPIAFGVLVDRTGSWVWPYVIGGALLAIGAITILFTDPTNCADPEVVAERQAAAA
jgi:ACS family D-galactonate transporter-like MFS transporter